MTFAEWVTPVIQRVHQEAVAFRGGGDPACDRLAALLAGGGIEAGNGWAVLRAAAEKYLSEPQPPPPDEYSDDGDLCDPLGVRGDHDPSAPDRFVYGMLHHAAWGAGSHPLLSGRLTPKQRGELAGKAVQHLRAAVDALGMLGVQVRGWDFDGLGNAHYALGRYRMIGTTPEDFAQGPEVLSAVRGVLDRLLQADLLADVVLPVALEKLADLESEPLPPRVADDGSLEKKIAACHMERLCVMCFRKPYRASVAALVGAMFGDYDFDDERLKDAMRRLGQYVCWF